jgi:phosphosulfolactate phosphohydrolase-like enzyme
VEAKIYEFESGVRRAVRAGAGALVIIDAIRASPTVCALAASGARVHPFADTQQALLKLDEGWIVVGESGEGRSPGIDYDNSPVAVLAAGRKAFEGKDVAFSTANGSRLMAAAVAAVSGQVEGGTAPRVLIGGFPNSASLVAALRASVPGSVALVAAGRSGERALEDYVCAQYLGALLAGDQDAAEFLRTNFHEQMLEAYERLEERGLLEDVNLCLTPGAIECVPQLDLGSFTAKR